MKRLLIAVLMLTTLCGVVGMEAADKRKRDALNDRPMAEVKRQKEDYANNMVAQIAAGIRVLNPDLANQRLIIELIAQSAGANDSHMSRFVQAGRD